MSQTKKPAGVRAQNSCARDFTLSDDPPNSPEAEASTIGGLILSHSAWPDVSAIVSENDFFEARNRVIFAAVRALASAGKPFDAVTLIDHLEDAGKLGDVGGSTWIGQCGRDTPSAANVQFYAKIVRRKSLARQRLAAIAKDDHHKAATITQTIDALEASSQVKPRLISVAELCSAPPKENWLIKGYLPTDSLGVLFGDPEAGKTFVLIDVACCVDTGKEWRGIPVKQGPVVYIAGEGKNGLAKRFKAWYEHHKETPRHIYLLTTPIQLTDPVSVAAVIEEIKALPEPPSLIIIDTVNRNFGPGDENSTGDMTLVVAGLDALRIATGATVLGSHHCGHTAKDRGRGSSVLKASVDFEFAIERFDRTVQIRCTKAKDFDHPPPLAWRFEMQPLPWADDDGAPINSAVLVPGEVPEPVPVPTTSRMGSNQTKALSLLREMYHQRRTNLHESGFDPGNAKVTRQEWYLAMKSAGISRSRCTEAKSGLEQRGLITVSGDFVYLTNEEPEHE